MHSAPVTFVEHTVAVDVVAVYVVVKKIHKPKNHLKKLRKKFTSVVVIPPGTMKIQDHHQKTILA